MSEIYEQPVGFQRFKDGYLKVLQGNTHADMVMPIAYWNPMAKSHLLDKIAELIDAGGESVATLALHQLNPSVANIRQGVNFQVSLCIADDLKGGWTNRHSTEYDTCFKLSGFLGREFCVPVFWSSETYTQDLIIERVKAACFRTIWRLDHPSLRTLGEHLDQEAFVRHKIGLTTKNESSKIQDFITLHASSEDFGLIFNVLYGDTASESLGMPTYGLKP